MPDFQDFLLLKMKPNVWGLRETMYSRGGGQPNGDDWGYTFVNSPKLLKT